ncbi:MAG: AraC family transcriptional regulator [Lachnospiraceae bacterium]|nr:AraC family transcriptional regulator [Lachnospiraceae bacterium]
MKQPSVVSKDLKEICIHGTKSFPCAIYRTHAVGKGVFVKHHWHDEVEILYFSEGAFRLEINMESFLIQSECFYFVNPGELHSIIAETSDHYWEDAVVFSLGIFGLDSSDEVQIRLIKPIQNGKYLFPRCVASHHPAFSMLRSAFVDIMRAVGQSTEEAFAGQETAHNHVADSSLVTNNLTSQLYVKSSLMYIFATLFAHGLFMPTERNFDRRVESIKTALTFIKDNYQNKIYISDLAGQVNLNEQYFCRLFRKAIGYSPIEYINEYRIKQAKRLLEETQLQVTEVCLECGFNNLGNFLQEFRKHTGTTPLQYRKHMESL